MINYKDAVDLKTKFDKKYFPFSNFFKLTHFKIFKTVEELTDYISESVKKDFQRYSLY